jgi:4-amino-4-deoxy-L-arabinose transferase-like glycosyltransferase
VKTSAMLSRNWTRVLLAILILIALTRVVWQLDGKNLWWDESLSLQRAESDWPALLSGRIVISDGRHEIATLDQHPFTYFGLLGTFVRLAGKREFSLRFPSVIAIVLIVPTLWAFARRLNRLGVAPHSAAMWAALLAASSPFYLWFGQETRPYALWAFLAVLSTYLLLRWATADSPRDRRPYLIGYLPVLIAFLSTHYFSTFLLPFQALIAYRGLKGRRRWLPTVVVGSLLVVAGLVAVIMARRILQQPGAGTNFQSVSLQMLIPDLNNAFSLGLSVDIDRVRWLDLAFGAVALVGLAWELRSRRVLSSWGWVLPAFLLIPIAVLLAVNLFRPIWMTARHMSMISGAYLLLVAVGLGVLWERHRGFGAAVAVVLVAGMAYSTRNYFTMPAYGKDDLAGVGLYLREQMQPGDLALVVPPDGLRLMRYYLPLEDIERAAQAGRSVRWEAGPPLEGVDSQVEKWLQSLQSQYRRTWLVKSGVPAGKPAKLLEDWLDTHAFRVRDTPFESTGADVRVILYLPAAPVLEQLPGQIQYRIDASFGDQVRLLGYDVGQPLMPGAAVPVTLYWQALHPLTARLKYILRVEEVAPDGTVRAVQTTEREPYDGTLPTTAWPAGQVVVEYSEVGAPADRSWTSDRYRLVLQMYDAETLVKLPVKAHGDIPPGSDGETLVLPSSS